MKHQQIIDALKNRLTDIQTIGGYLTDIGKTTIRDWAALNIDIADMPYMNIRDIKDTQIIESVANVKHTLTVEVDVIAYGDNSASYIRKVYNDIMKVLGADPTLGGLVFEIQPTDCKIMAHQSVDKVMIMSVGLDIIYNTQYWDT